jgi:dTDP-L-rhamnose 4-epimerase
VLVTGGAGFIGSHIVDVLIAAGREVVVLDSLWPAVHGGTPQYLNDQASYMWADMRDPEVVAGALRDVDAVCHQAGAVGIERSFADVVTYVSNNDVGTASVLRALHAANWHGPLVLASSMVVYGEGAYLCSVHGAVRPGPRRSEDLRAGRFEACCPRCGHELAPFPVDESAPLDPRSIYAATKVHQEHLFAVFGRAHGVAVSALRYHNVYGPRMARNTSYAGVASIFGDALRKGRSPDVFEDGGQLRDFIHVRDVAEANLAALDSGFDGPVNVATGIPKSVFDMAAAMAAEIDPAITPRVTGRFRAADVRHVFASPARAATVLGWCARIPFADGMRELAAEAPTVSALP